MLRLRTTSRILRTARVPALAVALVVPVALPDSQLGLVPQSSSLAAMAAPPAGGQFTITDLGALGADAALGLNDFGDVVGERSDGQGFHYRQTSGALTELGPSPATAVSEAGRVVGFGRGTGPGGKSWGVSPNGLLVSGSAPQTGIIPPAYGGVTSWPAIWTAADGWRSLYEAGCRLPGLIAGLAYAVNDGGTLVGQAVWDADGEPSNNGVAGVAFACSPSVTEPGRYTGTNLAPYGGGYAGAFAINNRGQIAGKADAAGAVIQAYRWDGPTTIPLGTAPDGHPPSAGATNQSAGFGINDAGDVVGTYGAVASSPLISLGARQNRAFVWYDADHTMRDLNDLMAVVTPWTLTVATDINNRGQIVGQGLLNGELHGFLLSPTGDVNLTADHIMVTQVVQNEENLDLLVARKQTYAVVRLSSDTRNVSGVRTVLRGFRDGQALGEIKPVTPPLTVLQHPEPDDVTSSAVFALPTAWTEAGNLTLEAEVNDDFTVVETNYRDNQTRRTTVTFQPSPQLKVTVVDLGYENDIMILDPKPYNDVRRYLTRTFPVADPALTHDANLRSIPEPATLPGDAESKKCGDVVAELARIRAEMGVGANTLLYGLMPLKLDGASPYGGTVGGCSYVPDLVATGWAGPGRDWIAAHELSHAIGRNHVPLCGAVGADREPYPAVHGKVYAGSLHQDGFRTPGDMDLGFNGFAFLASQSPWDLMTYCEATWMSDYTYENLYRLIPQIGTRPRASLQAGDVAVHVVGTIDLLDESTAVSTTYAPVQVRPPAPVAGPYHLEFYNGPTKLSDDSFTPAELGPHDTVGAESPQALINETVALPAHADRIRIFSDRSGTEIFSAAIAGAPPTVTLVAPQPGQQLPSSGQVTFEWSGADPDHDTVTYTLLYRPADSGPWQVLASHTSLTSAAVDVSGLPGSTAGTVRVVAHDGFYTASDDNTGLVVPKKAPRVSIDDPASGYTATTDQAVLLTGSADGPDASGLTDSAYAWSSDRDGPLGVGRSIVASHLSVGQHRIELTVSQPNGVSASSSVTVSIRAAGETPSVLAVSHSELSYAFADGQTPPPQTLGISDPGGSNLGWTLTTDSPRVTVTDRAGTTPATIGVSVDTTGLHAGDHLAGSVTIGRQDGHGEPVVVRVTAQSSQPVSSLSAYALDFGRQTQGTESQARSVELTYHGADHLSLGDISLAGAAPDDFALAQDQCSRTTLNPGDSCSLRVSFRPAAAGRRTGYVEFDDAGGATHWYVSLTGLGIRRIAPPDGTMLSWGNNDFGQAGVSSTTPPCNRCVPVPTIVQGIDNVTAVAAGGVHTLAVTRDGRAWAWGQNCAGTLGNGATDCPDEHPVPQPVPGLAGVTDVAAGPAHSLALLQDGTISAWGSNANAAGFNSGVADGCTGFRFRVSPTPVRGPGCTGTLTGVVAIAAGGQPDGNSTSYALKNDGTVWQWGSLGPGTNNNTVSIGPKQVLGPNATALTNIVEIAHGLALRGDGTVWAWGYGADGQLGNGQRPTLSSTAVQVLTPDGSAPLTGVRAVASYQDQRYALTSQGTVLAWGSGREEAVFDVDAGIALGIGGTHPDGVARPTPVLAPGGAGPATGVLDIAPGIAAQGDGGVQAWGRGTSGALGDGSYFFNPWTVDDPGPGAPVRVKGVHEEGLLNGVAGLAGSGTRFALSAGGQSSTLTAGQPVHVDTTEGASFDGVVAGFGDTSPASEATLYAATLDWGDGTDGYGTVTGPARGPFQVRGAHTYAAPGTYRLTIDVTSRAGDSITLEGSASVGDAALTRLAGPAVHFVAGEPQTSPLAAFEDANDATASTEFTATAEWGDGSPVGEATVVGPPGGPFVVGGTHVYARAGDHPVRVTVSDADGSQIELTSTADVEPASLTAAATVTSNRLPDNTFSGDLATFRDGDPLSAKGDYTARINWGDGHQTSGTVTGPDGGPYVVEGSHAYTTTEPVQVSVTLTGPAGASATARLTLMSRLQRISLTSLVNKPTGDVPLDAVYSYAVSNDGADPVTGVGVVGSVCGAAGFDSGDNGNGVLDPGERWTFTCNHRFELPGTFTDLARAAGSGLVDAFPIQSQEAAVSVVANVASWPFSGFFQPVDNPPIVNLLKGGATVPVKFGLGGDRGLDVFASGFPASAKSACTSSPLDELETVAAPGSAMLSYDPVTQRYQFNWKTSASWAGTCRVLTLRFRPGGEQVALFRFK